MSDRKGKGGMKTSSRKSSKGESSREDSKIEGKSGSGPSIDLSCILKKKWKVFRVSPLFNFINGHLKHYEIIMNKELNAKKSFKSTTTYNCTFRVNEKLKLNEDDVEILEVHVTGNQFKSIYLGYFTSIVTSQRSKYEGSISLPILLVEARDHEMHNIHSTICKLFDCDIQPVTFPFHALVTFLGLILNCAHNSSNMSEELLHLEYNIPDCKVKNKVKVTLYVESTTIAYAVTIDKLRETNEEIQDMQIILEFYKKVLNHIYNVYQLDLMFAKLCKVSFPGFGAFITAEGELKLSTCEEAKSVLTSLYQFMSLDSILFA